MRKQTTTRQLNTAITNGLLQVTKAECSYKSSNRIDEISKDTFKESLEFLKETLFSDCVGWHFERNNQTGQYIAECGRMDGSSDIIITAYLCANEGVSREVIDSALIMIEEE